jgi:type IV pilus assembly protein PilM
MTSLSVAKKSNSTPTVIGLDIGSYAVKCIEVDTSSQKPALLRVSILPVNDPSPEAISKVLKVCLDPSVALSRRVRISLSGGSSLLIRRIQLPAMTASELKGAIRFEAESHIPFPVDECELDFQILSETPDRKSIHVLLVAAKKAFIRERLKLLEAVNVVPELIDVDIFCLINAHEVLGQADDATFGLLNIGHSASSFAIMHEKRPYFVREIPFGSKNLTQAIQKVRGVNEEEANRIKVEAASENGIDTRALALEGFEPLIEEIRHSVDYFENEVGEDLKTIRMSGGGVLFPGTAETFSEELGKQVSIWDNTQKLDIFGEIDREYLSAHACELNVALGMALRGLGGKR